MVILKYILIISYIIFKFKYLLLKKTYTLFTSFMKEYENYNFIRKFDIQEYGGLETEASLHFLNFVEKSYPITYSCCGITYPTPKYYIKHYPCPVFVLEHVISGKGYVIVNNKKHTVKAGDTYLLKPTENCEYFSDKNNPYQKIWINFRGPLAYELVSQYNLQDTIYTNVNLAPCFEKLFKIEEISVDLDIINFKLASIITEMLMLLAESKNTSKNVSSLATTIRNSLDYYINQPFSLENLAKELNTSKTEIIRQFKKAYNITPYQYVLKIKLAQAKIMLENGPYSIVEIAERFAFNNPYHFSEIFKEKIGLSPTEYRKKFQGK